MQGNIFGNLKPNKIAGSEVGHRFLSSDLNPQDPNYSMDVQDNYNNVLFYFCLITKATKDVGLSLRNIPRCPIRRRPRLRLGAALGPHWITRARIQRITKQATNLFSDFPWMKWYSWRLWAAVPQSNRGKLPSTNI